MFLLDICGNLSVLGILLFIKNIIKIICVIVPILLVLFLTIDFAKATMENNAEKMDKVKAVAVKRIIYAILVFFIPLIVNAVMGLLGDSTKFTSCYDLANSNNVQSYAEIEKLKQEERNATTNEEKQELYNKQQELYKKIISNRSKALIKKGSNSQVATVATKYRKSNGKVADAQSVRGRFDWNLGDQGGEVSKDHSAPKSATYIARFKDPNKAEIAARCAEAGADNDKIGYNASPRQSVSLYWEAKKVNWDLSKINVKCSTVCSTFVAVCINAAGTKIIKGLDGYSNNESRFKKTGDFEIIKPYKKSNLLRGDIIVWKAAGRQRGHMSIAR